MNPIVSIVSGTYNRLPHLQRMVGSVRFSVGTGVPYEIVLVDGGSKDGTIEWAQGQPDIRIIKHGKLLGAVKAFNDGAKAARGDYVILANDDVMFINESILAALSFMQDHPNVGIGCFSQDRAGRDWHVEEMSIVMDGKQSHAPYGQVCIVPKYLGDRVGWWGDYLRTYGGDNELSCNIYELGYRVQEIPCACIHDAIPGDELRAINNKVEPGKNHPDTQKWLDKWTDPVTGMIGPKVFSSVVNTVTLPRHLRILYAPIYERGYPIQKITKRGLREALSKRGMVVEVDYVEQGAGKVFDVANAFQPHIFLLQIQGIHEFDYRIVQDLKITNPNAKFVLWNGDYHEEVLLEARYVKMLKLFDLVGLVTLEPKLRLTYDRLGIHYFYWQIGYEEADHRPDPYTPHHDVLMLANGYSDARLNLARTLQALHIDFGVYGTWPGWIKSHPSTLYDFDAGAKLCNAATIVIGDSQWPHATGFVSNRLFQTMEAGGFLLQQQFDGIEELLGLRDGEHLVLWSNLDDLLNKIRYWLDPANDRQRKAIAAKGQSFIRERHSFDVRVVELFAAMGIGNA